MKITLIILFLTFFIQSSLQQGCPNVNIGTDTRLHDTVVKNGIVSLEWSQKDEVILMDTDSTDLDFLYVTITSKSELTSDNFLLQFSDK